MNEQAMRERFRKEFEAENEERNRLYLADAEKKLINRLNQEFDKKFNAEEARLQNEMDKKLKQERIQMKAKMAICAEKNKQKGREEAEKRVRESRDGESSRVQEGISRAQPIEVFVVGQIRQRL